MMSIKFVIILSYYAYLVKKTKLGSQFFSVSVAQYFRVLLIDNFA